MGLFDVLYSDPAKNAQKYLNQIPHTVQPYYNPYIQTGQRQLSGLESEYSRLMGHPNDVLKDIGAGYQQSPGYNFALQQALQGGQHMAAAGGMAGSPMAQQQGMELAQNIANRDYQDYLKNALGLYGIGLEGSQGLLQGGMNSSDILAKILSGSLGSQASLGYAGGANRNMMGLGTIGALVGAASPFVTGVTKPWIFQ